MMATIRSLAHPGPQPANLVTFQTDLSPEVDLSDQRGRLTLASQILPVIQFFVMGDRRPRSSMLSNLAWAGDPAQISVARRPRPVYPRPPPRLQRPLASNQPVQALMLCLLLVI